MGQHSPNKIIWANAREVATWSRKLKRQKKGRNSHTVNSKQSLNGKAELCVKNLLQNDGERIELKYAFQMLVSTFESVEIFSLCRNSLWSSQIDTFWKKALVKGSPSRLLHVTDGAVYSKKSLENRDKRFSENSLSCKTMETIQDVCCTLQKKNAF